MNKKPYCPRNGCGMPNGTAMSYPVYCNHCNTQGSHFEKLCTFCKKCRSCGRIGKKFINQVIPQI
jgi:hypothetical protein